MRIFVDMDGVLCDYEKSFREKFIAGKLEFPQTEARFFENLDPIHGAISGFKWLSLRYDVWIATRPSVDNLILIQKKEFGSRKIWAIYLLID